MSGVSTTEFQSHKSQAAQHVAFVNWLLTNILETLPSRIMRMVGTGWLTTVAI